ncbi:uncharacterized protein RHOBADRAFT_41338 [Rhodotorula graminis WP1]|uniref:Uncharacterized protein n=1 Tax=Rhodotorula graminis (strain WP1) TaxID=578459 RepID=A0A194SA55_RHOGW|nr:uncharacterized protein RHOBADRAFT_41338 [Rhodotorula graminis WP1]KPV77345.1 hypothetical protein RHOBADRAFT_41338 [Rhodotorula graminis WP1]
MTLLWPTHKVLCGRDPTLFYLPPLTPAELATMNNVKDRLVEGSSISGTLAQYARRDPHAATVEVFLILIALEPGSNRLINLNYHLHYLVHAYLSLEQARLDAEKAGDAAAAAAARSPWLTFAHGYPALRDVYTRARDIYERDPSTSAAAAADTSSIFSDLNLFLRRDIVHATLLFQASRPSPRIDMSEVLTLRGRSAERSLRDLRTSTLPQGVQAALIAHYRDERESVQRRLEEMSEG